MPTGIQYQTGAQNVNDGVPINARGGRQGEGIFSELHGRFYEQAFRGNLFSIGHTGLVALSANTITLTATTTPILGVWNPATSPVNLVMTRCSLEVQLNNVTSVAPGAFVWASSVGNTAITTGLPPFSRLTMQTSGSQAKGFAGVTALTGLTNNLIIFEGAEFATASALSTTAVAATTPTPSTINVHLFDGSLIVPPGGVLALLNTVSSVTHSVKGLLLWEEVPKA